MKEKLLKTTQAEYVERQWDGKNLSGIFPVCDRVLIMPDSAAEVIRGVHIDPRAVERMSQAAESGIVVEIGEGAFLWNADRTRPFAGRKPKVGDRVNFQRFAGCLGIYVTKTLYKW